MRESRQSRALIAIVGDDRSVRRGLEPLVRSVRWKADTLARPLLGLTLGYHSKAIVALVEKVTEKGRPG